MQQSLTDHNTNDDLAILKKIIQHETQRRSVQVKSTDPKSSHMFLHSYSLISETASRLHQLSTCSSRGPLFKFYYGKSTDILKTLDSPTLIGARKVNPSMASQRGLQTTPSPWEELMRKFSEEHKEECRSESFNIPLMMRSKKLFPTGSTYVGSWDVLGMSGYGTYTFPNGVVYEGDFSDGLFHGQGELRYPSGEILRGKWNKGVITSRKLIFADGLEYSETNWTYCRMPDRRYTIEYNNGLQPAGESYLTAEQPTRPIPDGCYDAGDGFYDTKTKMVHKYDDATSILRSPSVQEQKWIIDNCRSASVEPVGPRVDLYEEWLGPQVNKGSEAGKHTPVQRGSAGKSSFEDLYASKFMLCHRPTIYDERGRKVPRFSNEVIEN